MATIRPFRALRPRPSPPRASPPCPTTSSTPTRRARSPPATPSASSTSRAPRSTCRPAPTPTTTRSTRRRWRTSPRSSGRRWSRRRRRRSTSTAWDGRPRADRPRRLLLGRRVRRDLIKKHERTRRDKEDDRTRHIVDLRAQTGPVFLTYRHQRRDRRAWRRASCAGAPLYDFTAADGIGHTVWRADAEATAELVAGFTRLPASTSPTGTTAPPRRRGRTPSSLAKGAGESRGRARAGSSPSPSPTTRCRSCPTTAWCKDLRGRRPGAVPRRASASASRCSPGRPDAGPQGASARCTSPGAGTPSSCAPPRPRRQPTLAGLDVLAAAGRRCSAGCSASRTRAPTSASTSSAASAAPASSSARVDERGGGRRLLDVPGLGRAS